MLRLCNSFNSTLIVAQTTPTKNMLPPHLKWQAHCVPDIFSPRIFMTATFTYHHEMLSGGQISQVALPQSQKSYELSGFQSLPN